MNVAWNAIRSNWRRKTCLIIDELWFVPLSKTGAELLFEVISRRYERGSIIITSNLPFDEWTEVFGSECLTGAIFDRLTHHVHILEMNGESFRLREKPQSNSLIPPPTRNPELVFGQCALSRVSYLKSRPTRREQGPNHWRLFHRCVGQFLSPAFTPLGSATVLAVKSDLSGFIQLAAVRKQPRQPTIRRRHH